MSGIPWTIDTSAGEFALAGENILYDSQSNVVAEYSGSRSLFRGISMYVSVGQSNYLLRRRRRLFRLWYEVIDDATGRLFAYATPLRFSGGRAWRLTDFQGNEMARCDTASPTDMAIDMADFISGAYDIIIHGEPLFRCEGTFALQAPRLWPIKNSPLTPEQLQLCAVMVGMYMVWRRY